MPAQALPTPPPQAPVSAPDRRRWRRSTGFLVATLLVAGVAAPAAAADRPHRVLLLTADPGASPGGAVLTIALRSALLEAFPLDLEFGIEPLDLVWAGSPQYRLRLAELLQAKYEDRQPELLIPVGTTALQFVLAERQALFPRAMILFGLVERGDLDALDLPRDIAGVVHRWGFEEQVEVALHLLPETRRAVVVLGDGPVERANEARFRRDLAPFAERIELDWWIGVPVKELEERIAGLPPATIVVYIAVYRDRTGATFIPTDVLDRLARRTSAPIFSSLGHNLGRGLVGDGRFDIGELGTHLGVAAARLLRGEPAEAVGVVEAPAAAPRFDARQLARWRIPRERLPADSRVLFESPSVWSQYRSWILGGASLLVLQALLIAGLVAQRVARRRAELSERRVRDLSTTVVDSLRPRIAILDREGKLLAVNRAWKGFARAYAAAGVAVGDNYLEAGRRALERGREDARRSVEGIAAVLGGRTDFWTIEYSPAADGEERRYEMTVVSLGRQEGGAVVAIEDVTERRRDAERLRLAMEALPVATVLVGPGGEIELINAETERLFGYGRDELLGQPVEALIPENFHPKQIRHRDAAAGPSPARTLNAGRELLGRRKDGSEVPVEVGVRQIPTSAGTRTLAAIVDLSERRRLEHEALWLRAEAAHFGRLASAGELSAAIAHELNQPLTGILTNAQAAQRFLADGGAARDDLAETLADIAADGRRAGEVIRRLRTLLGKGPIELVPLDLNETVEQVVRLVGQDLHLRGAQLDLELAPDLPWVSGDRVHLQQVVLNLILNGIDAMAEVPAGSRRLLLRTARGAERTVELEVRDAGPGIAPEALPHLFEPFYTTKPEGMGMGLSIVRSIVESHGGRVRAGNNPSGGAVFTVSLPAAAREKDPA